MITKNEKNWKNIILYEFKQINTSDKILERRNNVQDIKMTSNPVTSLAWVRSPGDALVVKRGGR
jgi:hypothetical protein